MIVAQLSDTHVVRPGATYFDLDTSRFLSETIDALHALERPPECVVVTGDLVNGGRADEYVRFREIMATLRFPYFVIPGNHDERDVMRDALPAHAYGESHDSRVRYAIDDFEVRIIGLDANGPRPWPGAAFDLETLAWLERTVGREPRRPTILCVHHQPPFRTGLHYLDVFGFRGARRLQQIVARHAEIGRVISGHIHCVRTARWGETLACSAPSTSPQIVPLLLMDGRVVGKRDEAAGFALHEWTANAGFTTTVHRRDAQGRYVGRLL